MHMCIYTHIHIAYIFSDGCDVEPFLWNQGQC